MTEILPFAPLISLVCNLQIYTCFTSYDEKKKKNTQTKFYQWPTFLPNLLFFPETFFSSASSTIPYNGENNRIKKVPRMSFQLPHRMINFFLLYHLLPWVPLTGFDSAFPSFASGNHKSQQRFIIFNLQCRLHRDYLWFTNLTIRCILNKENENTANFSSPKMTYIKFAKQFF